MAKAQILVRGSVRGRKQGDFDTIDLTSREAVESCDSLAVFCNGDASVDDAVTALSAMKAKFPVFKGTPYTGTSENGTPYAILPKAPNGTSLDALLAME